MPKKTAAQRYAPILVHIFQKHWKRGSEGVEFEREELIEAAATLGIRRPDNLGDVIYAFKFRRALPPEIIKTAPNGKAWILDSAGRSRYRFRLVASGSVNIEPRADAAAIRIPDATPEIIEQYKLDDEQALLAKVRYNRLIDIFLGITTYSLQNHLRTHVRGRGQIEIDEIYVGVNRVGERFVVPVQAKGKGDKLSPVQTLQDAACCAEKFPALICRPISAQFMKDETIALFELTVEAGEVLVVDEKHYKLVPADSTPSLKK